jgi:hypothetical protein
MELILNLFWLLLTIPALWLWHKRGLRRDQSKRSCLLLISLGCLLILLFPVISASDDLRAMRTEAEDPIMCDSLRDSSAGRSSQPADHQSAAFAVPEAQFVVSFGNPVWSVATSAPASKAGLRLIATRVGRAPPLSSLEYC